jgi:dCTP deaminase
MILTGSAITDAVHRGDIVIRPFCPDQIGPNSYDFRLGDRCRTYVERVLDAARPNPTVEQRVGPEGLVLEPDRVYLFNTEEEMGSTRYVPVIRGRSSFARLGVFIDITADLIDIGSVNQWTLQLHAVMPVRVYPRMLVGQVTFWCVQGEVDLYRGKYVRYESPVPSLAYTDPIFARAKSPVEQTPLVPSEVFAEPEAVIASARAVGN